MKTAVVPRSTTVIVGLILSLSLASCDQGPMPSVGETYETLNGTLDGGTLVRVYSATELELKRGSDPNVVAKYTVEEAKRVRVVLTSQGTTAAVYFKIQEGGLVDEDGMMLLPSSSLLKARDDHFCPILRKSLERVVKAEETIHQKGKPYADLSYSNLGRGTGHLLVHVGPWDDPGDWYVAVAFDAVGCSKAYVYAPVAGGLQEAISIPRGRITSTGDVLEVVQLVAGHEIVRDAVKKSEGNHEKMGSE